MRYFSHLSGKSLFVSALKKTGAELFFSKEPHWHQGLFYVLFTLITCRHIIKENLSVIHTNPYYSLPLFDFFKIPDPTATAGFLFPKTRFFYGVTAISFHIGVLLFLGIKFNPFFYYYVVLIPELYLFFRKAPRARRV